MQYNYSLTNDFPNGLVNSDLKEEINNSTITPICTSVNTMNDNVNINFDMTLSSSELTTLNNIIQNYVYEAPMKTLNVDEINYNDYGTKYFTVMIQNLSFIGGTSIKLENWTHTSGWLPGFDTTLGEMTFDDGMYMWGMNIITQTGNNDHVNLRLFTPSTNASKYFQSLGLNMYIPEGAGGTTFSGANSMFSGDILSADLTFDLDETADIILRVNRLI